jgi:hypothetical protein
MAPREKGGAQCCKSPVAFFVFNRPLMTEKVFQRIREVRPPQLFVVADGPREGNGKDFELCAATRRIVSHIDWECQVEYDFSDSNLGCGLRVSSGLDWVFSRAERAIILEDDCLPDVSFFRFCDELLERYDADPRVMCIGGTNVLGTYQDGLLSYRFAYSIGGVWGWASWRRAWRLYDYQIKAWAIPAVREKVGRVLHDDRIFRQKARSFDAALYRTWSGTTWDWQWSFARIYNEGLTAIPSRNLVTNIGFGLKATHTRNPFDPLAALHAQSLPFPLRHPVTIACDREFDRKSYRAGCPSVVMKIWIIVRRALLALFTSLKRVADESK